MNTKEIYENFASSKNIEDLWRKFCLEIRKYSLDYAFYAIGHTSKGTKENGFDALWFKSNYPKEYLEYFDTNFNVEDDHTILHCLTSTLPYIWHDPIKTLEQNQTQKEFELKSREFGISIGVTLPLRFHHFGVGGFGLCTTILNEDEFDNTWNLHQDIIQDTCKAFDENIRSQFILEMYPLTLPEIDALNGLIEGKNIKKIANDLGKSPSTIEKQVRSAREKLKAKNDKQATVKALILGIISI